MHAPSIKDVAETAGVSVGTVSNVLNRPHLVSEGTRRRVQAVISDLGFVRNESARQLRAGSSRSLAFVVLDATNPLFTDVARGVEEEAREAGLAVYLCNSAEDRGREEHYLELLLEQRVRGVLITPVERGHDKFRELTRRGVPVVLVDRAGDEDWCSVSVDDVEGGELAITHLLEQGHRRIAFVGGPDEIVQVHDRHQGALQALRAGGRRDKDLVVLATSALSVSEGRRAGERLAGLPAKRRPTAAFCANDLLALGLLQEMTRQGLRVPRDLAIVGHDDIEFAAAAAVPLSSVRQPRQLLGRTATRLLLEEASGERHEHRSVRFRPELAVRASSVGGPRRR